jgi:hypothetical protein
MLAVYHAGTGTLIPLDDEVWLVDLDSLQDDDLDSDAAVQEVVARSGVRLYPDGLVAQFS